MNPFYSMRLGASQQTDFENLREFVDIFCRNPGCCDEVWFSTPYGYPSLDSHRRIAGTILEGARYVRERGITASLQISNTIGHGSYNQVMDFSGFSWDCMVGFDGTLSPYCCCPRDDDFLSYIEQTTGYYAQMKPAAVWIDDDLRIHHHSPVQYGCFCDRCVDAFNRQYHTNFNRAGLAEAVNDPADSLWRMRFTDFNQDSLIGVALAVSRAVMTRSPESVVAVQLASFSWQTYSGHDFKALFDAIRAETGKPSAARPGGGYYNDHEPRAVFAKAINMASSNERMPGDVTVAQAEIENIPHCISGKSPYGTLVESAVDLAYGCTSLSFSAFMIPNEKPSFYEPLMAGLARWRPFLTRYARHNAGTVNGGAGMVFSPTHNKMCAGDLAPFAWSGFGGQRMYAMVFYGMPLGWQNGQSAVLLLHHSEVDALSDEELRDLFSGGVITDAPTVAKLEERGLGSILGLKAEDRWKPQWCDLCTDEPFNGEYTAQSWFDFYTSMDSPSRPMCIVASNPTARIIGRYIDHIDQSATGEISSVLVETAQGGRAAVFAYNPWESLVNSARRHQMLRAADWVSRGRMPVLVETPSQVAVIPRVDAEGVLRSVMLVNASIEASPELTVLVRSDRDAVWVTPENPDVPLPKIPLDEGFRLKIDSIAPWSLGVIEFKCRERA